MTFATTAADTPSPRRLGARVGARMGGLGGWLARLTPGVLLCLLVTAAGFAVQAAEAILFGKPWLESLVLAILVGATVRSVWRPPAVFAPGVGFSGKVFLEVAIVLLGLTVSPQALSSTPYALWLGVAAMVVATLAAGYGLGKLLRLPERTALLVAGGNAICGNSAIAALAPVIGATADEVGAAIAFTAAAGVAVVLSLPAIGAALHFDPVRYGMLSGLMVYAVPQVLAAASPAGPVAVQIGTLVKLMRVVTLGPVCMLLPHVLRREQAATGPRRPMAPWFVVGFVVMIGVRGTGVVPPAVIAVAGPVSAALTTVSLAALGLGVDIKGLARSGWRVSAAALGTLALLFVMSVALISIAAPR